MDSRKFMELIKNLQSVMKCPACGSIYEQTQLQFMGQQDGYFLLSLTCDKCSLPVWVNVFSGNGSVHQPVTDLSILDLELSAREPISKDEVIGFHRNIKAFDGNFVKAFAK